jgi:hypothetical protein
MVIVKSSLLLQFPEIKFGFSTKIGLSRKPPYNFNLSHSVGDETIVVNENREAFFEAVGLNNSKLVLQKQTHSDNVTKVENTTETVNESDALITNHSHTGLIISSADCNAIFIYDPKEKAIGAVHSGWRGTEKNILEKTLRKMKGEYGSKSENLFLYFSPSISQKNYEVGIEVAELFDDKYSIPNNDKYLLDLQLANYDIAVNYGIPHQQIQVSNLCSYDAAQLLHSYRREGQLSGRALGVIAMD